VTFTATVTGVTPTGTVTFLDGATTLGTGTLSGSGTATFTTSALTTGSHAITAQYAGDANNTASTSNTVTQVVNKASTTTTVASSANPSSVGQAVTFTATVTGSTPTGTVTFFDGATALGTGTLSGAGTATFTTSALTLGNHAITAKYNGDANNSPAPRGAIQAVNTPADSLKLRAMQIAGTQIAAQMSGQAISGAIDTAINAGFSDNPAAVTPNANGFTFNFAADPDARAQVAPSGGLRYATADPNDANNILAAPAHTRASRRSPTGATAGSTTHSRRSAMPAMSSRRRREGTRRRASGRSGSICAASASTAARSEPT